MYAVCSYLNKPADTKLHLVSSWHGVKSQNDGTVVTALGWRPQEEQGEAIVRTSEVGSVKAHMTYRSQVWVCRAGRGHTVGGGITY